MKSYLSNIASRLHSPETARYLRPNSDIGMQQKPVNDIVISEPSEMVPPNTAPVLTERANQPQKEMLGEHHTPENGYIPAERKEPTTAQPLPPPYLDRITTRQTELLVKKEFPEKIIQKSEQIIVQNQTAENITVGQKRPDGEAKLSGAKLLPKLENRNLQQTVVNEVLMPEQNTDSQKNKARQQPGNISERTVDKTATVQNTTEIKFTPIKSLLPAQNVRPEAMPLKPKQEIAEPKLIIGRIVVEIVEPAKVVSNARTLIHEDGKKHPAAEKRQRNYQSKLSFGIGQL